MAALVVLAGCGILTPTPARFRPPLPDAEPMPGFVVDDVILHLTAGGLDCERRQDSEFGPSVNCSSGGDDDERSAGFGIEEDGIFHVGANRRVLLGPDTGPEPAVLDEDATSLFRVVVDAVVPEEHRPTDSELRNGVLRNFPMELGGGWYLGFDRSSVHRTLSIIYSSDGE